MCTIIDDKMQDITIFCALYIVHNKYCAIYANQDCLFWTSIMSQNSGKTCCHSDFISLDCKEKRRSRLYDTE